ncbi:hypothetical protein EI77_00824 [Prosthecobacter fusiformis]|uniref:Uncharacterized protein n=1 Tax=Prosthecobacter fusiformis TaxID=48464 RepID=A0A4R7SRC7_9BACT|nr:hypothetical protein [Prosthecobacter fusiformis]TDU81514.1 hypothetical protein EI77_00824 [Prosthecobacter fusiformis]
MNDRLTLAPPTMPTRLLMGFCCLFIITFGCSFAALPLWHIIHEGLIGKIPWPLVAFATPAAFLGLLIIWAGCRLRVWILPYCFTVDRQAMICGYLWKENWVGKISLNGIQALTAEPGWSRRSWPWVLYARFANGKKRQCILNSLSHHGTERAAYEECIKISQKIAHHLSVNLEMAAWSDKLHPPHA